MKLATTMLRVCTGLGAWNAIYMVPNTRADERRSAVEKSEQHRAKSLQLRDFLENRKTHQETAQHDHAKQQQKLQAEADRVVLLCRD